MAKLKVEVTNAYHERNGLGRRAWMFANVDRLARLGAATAPVSNWLGALPGSGRVLEATLGIARERTLPSFHRKPFTTWFADRGGSRVPENSAAHHAILFPDTDTNYHHPAVGRSAVRLLEAANVHVAVPDGLGDTGRPAFSNGVVDVARRNAARNVEVLAPYVGDSWDVVVCEPSDAVMLKSDYFDLLEGADVTAVAGNTYGVMEYFDRLDLDVPLVEAPAPLTYHGHCHQKASKRAGHAPAVLRRAGYDVDVIDSGCCGMAGSFGYEAEHYAMSQAIGRILFEQVDRSPGEAVVAPGTSCRTQLGDHGRDVVHPVVALAEGLDQGG